LLHALLALGFCLVNWGMAQAQGRATLDSLHRACYAARSDSEGVAAMNALANYHRNSLPDSALFHAKKAQELAEKTGGGDGLALALLLQATVNRIVGNYPVAMELSQRAIGEYEKANNQGGLGQTYNNIGLIYLRENELAKAAQFFFIGIGHARQANNLESVSVILNNLGLVAQNQQQYDSAVYYFQASYQLSRARRDSVVMANNLRNLGNAYRLAGRTDSALYYLPLARRIYQRTNNPISEAVATLGMARIYLQRGLLGRAQYLADSVLGVVLPIRAKETIRDAYLLAYEIHKRGGQAKEALIAHEQYINYKDSIFSEEKVKALKNLQANFELERAQRENEVLAQREKTTKLLLLVSGSGLLLLMSLLLILWRNHELKKRALRQLTLKNDLVAQQNAELARQQAEIATANQQLVQRNRDLADLNREQEGLMGIVAHDLRSPFTQLRGLVQLVQMGGPLATEQEQYLQMAEKVAEGGLALVRDILYMSELENKQAKLSPEPLRLNEWMPHFLRGYGSMAEKKQIRIVTEPYEHAADIITDPGCLKRILDNLISNALKFSPLGTQVTVRWRIDGAEAHFSVRDQGPGLSDDDKARLFKKFQKLSARPTGGEESTGLGLAIVKILADRLDGRVGVDNQLGQGAEFFLVMPVC
jgi:signal transduction histidine kinase